MADDRHYTITIYDKTGVNTGISRKAIANDDADEKSSNDVNDGGNPFAWLAVQRAVPYVKRIMGYNISQVSVRTGRQEEQQKQQFAFDMLNELGGVAYNVLLGAKAGGAVGAVAAAGVTALNAGINVFQKFDALKTQQNLESISLGLLQARTGGINIYTDNSR